MFVVAMLDRYTSDNISYPHSSTSLNRSDDNLNSHVHSLCLRVESTTNTGDPRTNTAPVGSQIREARNMGQQRSLPSREHSNLAAPGNIVDSYTIWRSDWDIKVHSLVYIKDTAKGKSGICISIAIRFICNSNKVGGGNAGVDAGSQVGGGGDGRLGLELGLRIC
jgi:hypothetical protein